MEDWQEERLELEAKRKELTELAKKLGTSHPEVQKLNREVERLMLVFQRKIKP
jgi:uncharacterized protein involved in exopolysaccharide biosynthesis